jgi:pyridoxamine 5'-phosphate oxidase-like protein
MADRTPGDVAREIIDANLYMVLATADEAGRPWASPVYFANAGYTEFFWLSSPGATHSRNIARRPDVGIVIFDSQVPISTGQGVYMTAVAEAVEPEGIERGLDVFSRRSLTHGGVEWTRADVEREGESAIRLYRATAAAHSILAKDGKPDHRIPVDLPGDIPAGIPGDG